MSCRKKYIRDGTNQFERLPEALIPANIQIEDRTIQQLLEMIRGVVAEINFFNLENEPHGSWENYFPQELPKFPDASAPHDIEPSFALFLTFLELNKYLKEDLNALTGKHLYYYFRDVLRFTRRPQVGEKVHLIFEPAKNVNQHLIEQGTQLTAGPDENGRERIYETVSDLSLNPAMVAGLKSVYLDKDERLYASGDATFITETQEKKDGEPKWSAFGSSQKGLSQAERTMEEADIGFAIASPQFCLVDGEREIEIVIACKKLDPLVTPDLNMIKDIRVQLSTENEWFVPRVNSVLAKSIGATELELTINASLSATDPAVIHLPDTVMAAEFNTDYPVARFKLVHHSAKYKYAQLRSLEFKSADITVTVSGKKQLTAMNDSGVLDPAKPFFPFGVRPDRGSSLYLGSAEIFSKELDYITLEYNWEKLPENDFDSHYENYNIPETFDNQIFKAVPSVLSEQDWHDVSSDEANLFNASNSDPHVSHKFTKITDNASGDNLKRKPDLQPVSNLESDTARGLLRLQFIGAKHDPADFLTNLRAFGHHEFNDLYTNVAIHKAQNNPDDYTFPNQPYTPLMSNVSLGYSSSLHITFSEENSFEQFFHIEPFGYAQPAAGSKFQLLPQYTDEGNFYLGLTGVEKPFNISLLFQLAEGTAQANPENTPEPITWSYLTANDWEEFDSLSILKNTTQGLQKSGIIAFDIGTEAIKNSTLFPETAYWIKASIPKFSEGVCQLINIFPNAIEAEYVFPEIEEDMELVETSRVLPENSISKLVVNDRKVKKITQPFPSFGGKSSEDENNYLARVSERLRHKHRGINVWDYERIVLEKFPVIYKVKCLEHASLEEDYAPGAITLIVITNLRNTSIGNPLEPKTGFDTLLDIKGFISGYISPFVEVNVVNPSYEQLLVDCKVAFHTGYDGGYYLNKLNDDIKRFLSPWAYEEGKDIVFGGKIYRSDILQFVENQPYVDYVTDFKLYHIYEGATVGGIGCMVVEDDFIVHDFHGLGLGEMTLEEDFVIGYESEVAIGNTPRSILVSAARHRIELIEDYSVCKGGVFGGIGFMSTEIDFVVT